MEKLKGWDPGNFMLRHNMESHPEDDPLCRNYTWEPTGFHQRPMQREISKAIKIKDAYSKERPLYIVMNARTEFNRCILRGVTKPATKRLKTGG